MDRVVRIWYVAPQRLCNFHCDYCVSVGDYAKSDKVAWNSEHDRTSFEKVVEWLGTRPYRIGVRLATLGEPFASLDFIDRAAWLTQRENVEFVELVTNGSLLIRRLKRIATSGNIDKLSLWITRHHSEIGIDRLIKNAAYAQNEYGCFVVVNALLFSDNHAETQSLRRAAESANLRFNLDIGNSKGTPSGWYSSIDEMVPGIDEVGRDSLIDRAVSLGGDRQVLSLNVVALSNLEGRRCSSGSNYFYIGTDASVYRCSRYHRLGKERLGNVLDEGFDLGVSSRQWKACEARFGCSSKEDYLNLETWRASHTMVAPSLGWTRS
jgi:MoaA/NifB/PqqE/SkfB family radical SAM enzyme